MLIIYCGEYKNKGVIQANGRGTNYGYSSYYGGGASGGGSVNIFVKDNISGLGTVTANGGNGQLEYGSSGHGGSGGTGSVSIGQIVDGTYMNVYNNYNY